MRAGQLRHRITLQAKTVTRDAVGGEVAAWADVATVWAEVDPWHLRQQVTLRRQAVPSTIGFRVRTPLDLSLDKRVVLDGLGYGIVEIDQSRRLFGELYFIAHGEEGA